MGSGPGLAVVGSSQRGVSSVALFNSGSLPHRWLLLVPDLLGGPFGQPAFLANYNLAEVTGYVGILPLVAAFALLARVPSPAASIETMSTIAPRDSAAPVRSPGGR